MPWFTAPVFILTVGGDYTINVKKAHEVQKALSREVREAEDVCDVFANS